MRLLYSVALLYRKKLPVSMESGKAVKKKTAGRSRTLRPAEEWDQYRALVWTVIITRTPTLSRATPATPMVPSVQT